MNIASVEETKSREYNHADTRTGTDMDAPLNQGPDRPKSRYSPQAAYQHINTQMHDVEAIVTPKGSRISGISPKIISPRLSTPFMQGLSPKGQPDASPKGLKHLSYLRKNLHHNHFYDEENLGENFDETPWLPPSIEKALEYKQERIFRGGNSNIRQTIVVDAPDLGVGVSMYFQLVKSLAICMVFLSLLSVPSLIFVYNGSKIPQEGK